MKTNVSSRNVFLQVLVVLMMFSTMAGQAANVSAASSNAKYEYYLIGNEENATPKTKGGLLLMGGSTDVDDGFLWMIEKSGGGDFVVISASGSDAYNPWINTSQRLSLGRPPILAWRRACYTIGSINRTGHTRTKGSRRLLLVVARVAVLEIGRSAKMEGANFAENRKLSRRLEQPKNAYPRGGIR